ncbi:hypothetical protein LTR10_007646 [Elasticomyces elasticus]|nr:hypothetical protein LTR10_007646 [Elasticomyces elasticus]
MQPTTPSTIQVTARAAGTDESATSSSGVVARAQVSHGSRTARHRRYLEQQATTLIGNTDLEDDSGFAATMAGLSVQRASAAIED